MFDIEQIANLSNLDINSVRTFLPDILNSIREYTHKTFITNVIISGEISISDGKIIISLDIPTDFIVNSNIELKGSINNTKIYTIKSIEDNKIETYETLFDETFNGFVIRLSFNGINNDILSSMISYKNVALNSSGVKSESIDGYTYTLDTDSNNIVNGYPISIMQSFNSMRQLPGSEALEYYNMGVIC